MKESTRNSTINQSEREKKLARERKREEKELKRMQDAIQKKLGSNNPQMDQSKKSATLPTMPIDTGSSKGGWTNTSSAASGGGWSATSPIPIAKPRIPIANSIPIKSNLNPTNPMLGEATASANAASSQPKKLSFGLKKSTGFQFGLKKK